VAERDAPLAQVVGRQFEGDTVTRQDADVVLAHLAAGVGDELVAVLELHAKARVGQYFFHDTVDFDQFFLGHARVLICSDRSGTKKPRRVPRFLRWHDVPVAASRRDRANVRGLRALLALFDFELDALGFSQRLEARALDLAEMGEQILAAAILGDESKALAFVEPFNGARLGGHEISLIK
jgi:hypothetical protein